MNIKFEAPEFLALQERQTVALERIAAALEGGQVLPDKLEVDSKKIAENAAPKKTPKKSAPKEVEPEEPETEEEELGAEEAASSEPEITLATVRAKLSALTQKGLQSEAKKLITGFGVSRISELDPSDYLELMEKAEAALEKA